MQNLLQLSTSELAMAEEIFTVMEKYRGKTRDFDIQLSHSHFPIKDDEVLYETHDVQTRTLTIKPVHPASFNKVPLATAWHKAPNGSIQVSTFCCDSDDTGDGSDWGDK